MSFEPLMTLDLTKGHVARRDCAGQGERRRARGQVITRGRGQQRRKSFPGELFDFD